MELRSMLLSLLTWVFYPLWLLAGAADYFCHRATKIEHTSGVRESCLHVAQFICLATALGLVVWLEVTWPVLLAASVAVLTHSGLAFLDVSYTQPRRLVTPLEQHVHGYMEVLPVAGLCLIAIVNWPELASAVQQDSVWRMRAEPLQRGELLLLLGSFVIIAGLPVAEELIRTLRARSMPVPAEV